MPLTQKFVARPTKSRESFKILNSWADFKRQYASHDKSPPVFEEKEWPDLDNNTVTATLKPMVGQYERNWLVITASCPSSNSTKSSEVRKERELLTEKLHEDYTPVLVLQYSSVEEKGCYLQLFHQERTCREKYDGIKYVQLGRKMDMDGEEIGAGSRPIFVGVKDLPPARIVEEESEEEENGGEEQEEQGEEQILKPQQSLTRMQKELLSHNNDGLSEGLGSRRGWGSTNSRATKEDVGIDTESPNFLIGSKGESSSSQGPGNTSERSQSRQPDSKHSKFPPLKKRYRSDDEEDRLILKKRHYDTDDAELTALKRAHTWNQTPTGSKNTLNNHGKAFSTPRPSKLPVPKKRRYTHGQEETKDSPTTSRRKSRSSPIESRHAAKKSQIEKELEDLQPFNEPGNFELQRSTRRTRNSMSSRNSQGSKSPSEPDKKWIDDVVFDSDEKFLDGEGVDDDEAVVSRDERREAVYTKSDEDEIRENDGALREVMRRVVERSPALR